ncbi:hypothetical protein C9994_05285 [Marivirga lumbricoides]|uniref:Uncharacterized protein n=1 Tax=Marivirga lumbricoides TaxID=1046115 RepID=A0A2T4DSY6_9BACT|nr:hypothetical protein C9994_05285 [Marivirga lumbricoides]
MDNELKDLWSLNTSDVELSEKKIDTIVKSKSTTLIAKIIKTIKIEHIINLISFPLFLALTIYESKFILSIFTIVLFVPFLIYYNRLLIKLKQAKIELNVHDYLIKCYKNLKAFVLHYKIASTSLAVISFFISLNYDFQKGEIKSVEELRLENSNYLESIFAIVIGLIILFAVMWTIIHLLYAGKMKKLKRMIEELEN